MRETILLGKVFKYKKGVKPKYLVEESIEDGIPYLTAKYFREKKPEAYTKDVNGNKFVRANIDDVILIWDGSNAGDVFRGLSGALASTMVKFEKNEKILDDFLFFFLKTKFTLLNSKTIGSTIPHVSKNILDNLEIPYFPLPEQRKIAYVLSTVQKAIEQQDKLIRHTTELKKALMQKLFTEGIGWLSGAETKQKQTEIGPVPESWEVVELGKVMKITSGGTPSRARKEFYNGDILWVKSGELEDNYIVDTEEKITLEAISSSSAKVFPIDTVLIAMYGATVGRTSILKKEAATNQAIAAILPNTNNFLPEFLRHFLIIIRDILLNQRYGGAQPNISQTIIKNLKVPKPSIEEQNEISRQMEIVNSKIEFHQKKKQTLTDLFKTLLHELMTGQRRVHKIEFEALNTEVKEMSSST